jgi:hypothetical protein
VTGAARELTVNDATVTKIVPISAVRSHRFTQAPGPSSGQRSAALSTHDRGARDPGGVKYGSCSRLALPRQ